MRFPVASISDDFAFSLSPGGWHYFRDLLAEHDRNPRTTLESSTFYRFFAHERVRRIRYLNDLLFLHKATDGARAAQFNFYLGTYPWGDWTLEDALVGGRPFGWFYDQQEGRATRDIYGYRRNPWYDPGDKHPLEIEWRHTIELLRTLRGAYRPRRFATYPSVVLLVSSDGELRAVRYEGHHRLCILSHLGYDAITVAIRPESIRLVVEDEVESWYYVARGLCSPQQALDIFRAFFDLNGRERLDALGLSAAY